MVKTKVWSLAALVVIVLAGLTFLIPAVPTAAADRDREREVRRDHWRHYKGHWSYWSEPDHRWYYTDGTHWYYRDTDGDAWKVYRFDRKFGREGFERGDYKVPGEGVKITLPRHEVYIR